MSNESTGNNKPSWLSGNVAGGGRMEVDLSSIEKEITEIKDSKDPVRLARLIEILKLLGSKLRESMTEGIKKAMHQAMDALKSSVVEMQWMEYVRNLLKDDFERGQKLLADIMNLIRSNAEMLKHARDTATEFGKDFWSDMKAAAERVKESLKDALKHIGEGISKTKERITALEGRLQEVVQGIRQDCSSVVIELSTLVSSFSGEARDRIEEVSSAVQDFVRSISQEEMPDDVDDRFSALHTKWEELNKDLNFVTDEQKECAEKIDKLFDQIDQDLGDCEKLSKELTEENKKLEELRGRKENVLAEIKKCEGTMEQMDLEQPEVNNKDEKDVTRSISMR